MQKVLFYFGRCSYFIWLLMLQWKNRIFHLTAYISYNLHHDLLNSNSVCLHSKMIFILSAKNDRFECKQMEGWISFLHASQRGFRSLCKTKSPKSNSFELKLNTYFKILSYIEMFTLKLTDILKITTNNIQHTQTADLQISESGHSTHTTVIFLIRIFFISIHFWSVLY